MTFEQYVKTLSDDELENIFHEIEEYQNTGVLKESGICRHKISEYDTGFNPMGTFQFFLFEICRRKYSH